MRPAQNVVGAIASCKRLVNCDQGMLSCRCDRRPPPASPIASATIVSSGKAMTSAMTRGTTRSSIGLMPIARSASVSSLICITPISAANALPERPATMMAVNSTPISRSTAIATRSTTKMSAPKRCSCWAPRYATITLMRNAISATIGIALMPVSWMCLTTDCRRSARGLANAAPMTATMRPRKPTAARVSSPCSTVHRPTRSSGCSTDTGARSAAAGAIRPVSSCCKNSRCGGAPTWRTFNRPGSGRARRASSAQVGPMPGASAPVQSQTSVPVNSGRRA